MTDNEEILRSEICDLKNQVYEITMYLEAQKQLIEQQVTDPGSYRQDFWSQQQIILGYISPEQSINVYVEFTTGRYKQIQPVISDNGGQTLLDFDMPYTGYVIVSAPYISNTLTLPYTPPVLPNNEIILLAEPEPVEPITRTGIHDTWQR